MKPNIGKGKTGIYNKGKRPEHKMTLKELIAKGADNVAAEKRLKSDMEILERRVSALSSDLTRMKYQVSLNTKIADKLLTRVMQLEHASDRHAHILNTLNLLNNGE